MLKIKNYGRDEYFECIDDLANALSQNHKGRHVSIVYSLPSGILKTLFVSVDSEGTVRECYGNESVVDLSLIPIN